MLGRSKTSPPAAPEAPKEKEEAPNPQALPPIDREMLLIKLEIIKVACPEKMPELLAMLINELKTPPAPSPAPPAPTLGEALVQAGLVNESQLAQALEWQKKEHGKFLGQVLVKMGLIKQDVLVQFLVKQYKVPHLSLIDYKISKDVLEIVPEDICREYQVLPIDKLGRILTLAMVDPLDAAALDLIRKKNPDLRIRPVLCNLHHFQTVIEQSFPAKETPAQNPELEKSAPAPKEISFNPFPTKRGSAQPDGAGKNSDANHDPDALLA